MDYLTAGMAVCLTRSFRFQGIWLLVSFEWSEKRRPGLCMCEQWQHLHLDLQRL